MNSLLFRVFRRLLRNSEPWHGRLARGLVLSLFLFTTPAQAQYTNPTLYRVPVMIDLRTYLLVVSNALAGGSVSFSSIA